MPSQRTVLLVAAVVLAILALSALPQAEAFGAGNIPSYSAMEGKAFRHGDLSDALSGLAKKAGGGLNILGKAKFSSLDIKRVYLANFLRDYSQANDVAGLTKLSKQSILTIVMVLAFMNFGYATGEFEVTEERLGVYRCEEHIDNPKGYADGKDAREVDPRLRGPVDPRELEIDPRTGMKNYIANESGGWATSSGMVRQDIMRMIQLGREARSTGNKDTLYEAYRLLGKVMHCMEDFPAHSNWCELALHRVGNRQVFLHVGDNVKVRSPQGEMVAPLVTGTFGGPDLVHSLLGETSDHLSSASVSDLNKAIDDAKKQQAQGSVVNQLMGFLGKVPGGVGGDVSRDADELSRGPSVSPESMNPQEIYANLFKILAFHDRVMMSVERTLEKIPGLSSLIENVSNSLATFTMTLIEPYVKPLMENAVSGLHTTSGTLVSGEDQYEVYENPNASDPTHSQLAKDHFELILNEVAGNVALIIDRHLVNNVVAAWDDTSKDPAQVAEQCLEAMFHPYFAGNSSAVQKEMLDFISRWSQAHPQEVARLDKAHCRAHTNTRSGKVSQGCGNNQSIAAPGASQQNTGFGPAMASYVGGKIGLPQAGSNSSANDGRPQRNEGGNSGYGGYSNTGSAGVGAGAVGGVTAAAGASSFFGETQSSSHTRPSHDAYNSGTAASGGYGSQHTSQQAHASHSGHHGHSQGQAGAGGYGSSGYPSSHTYGGDGQWQQNTQPQQPHHQQYGQQHQGSQGYGAPQHAFQPPPGPPPQYGGHPGGAPAYGEAPGGYGGYGGGGGGGFGGPHGLPRPPHGDPNNGPGGYGGGGQYGYGGGGGGGYGQQYGSGGGYGGGSGYGGGY